MNLSLLNLNKINALNHIGIIMDGNGRWAQNNNQERLWGHLEGSKVAKTIIEECSKIKLKTLTLYAFSTENWLRPKEEVKFLMLLLKKHLAKERQSLLDNNIKFSTIGDLDKLPEATHKEVLKTVKATKHCYGLNLIFALNYGARQEITNACKTIVNDVRNGLINPEDINETLFSSKLETSQISDPDLIIRTSGESRLSNFLLWQAAYSELHVSPVLWPDFSLNNFHSAINDFFSRNRRFGKTNITPDLKRDISNSKKPSISNSVELS